MHKNILFLQLEVIPNCPPHMGMCLFIDDLQRKGINCDAYIVNAHHVDEIMPVIEKGNYSLICLESIFTIDIINPILERFPGIPLLIGGVNALALLFHTDVRYAVAGPGRKAVSAFIDQYFGARDFFAVPNLFFKDGNRIFYSGRTEHWNLKEELFPYRPFLGWQYLGLHRNPGAGFNDVSIMAGTGCPYSNSTESSLTNVKETIERLGYTISDEALKRVDEIYNRKRHGCSFCIFQYQEHTSFPPDETVELLLKQAGYLFETHGITSFQVQTENPLPFLENFISALIGNGIPLQKVSIRTRTNLLLMHKNKLLKCLDLARKKDFRISIEQLGFESFYGADLLKFDKRVDTATNMEVLELLRNIKGEYGEHVSIDVGHGIILFHPWTTLESIAENLKVMSRYGDVFPQLFLGSLILYSEFLPIFPEILEENLVSESEYWYGMEYIMKDPLANKAYDLYKILISCFGGSIPVQGYLNSLDLIRSNSIDEILKAVFSVIPVSD
jgi:hypothetical protein